MRRFILLIAFLALAGLVNAQASTDSIGFSPESMSNEMARYAGSDPRQTELSSPGGLGSFVETILVLSLFVAGIYGVFRFIQRKQKLGDSAEGAIRVLARHGSGGSRAVEVIEVGRRVFLIGIGDAAINLIAEIDDEETLEELRLGRISAVQDQSEGFFERLISLLGRTKTRARDEINREKLEYLKARKERLARLKK